jgi:hypothetical protein
LIIILNGKIVISVRCELFKMSNVSHLTMFLFNNNSRGCFTLLSMHIVFSTNFSIALMNIEDFFKCTQVAISWEFWINCEKVYAHVFFLGNLIARIFLNMYGDHLLSSYIFSNTNEKKIFGHLLIASFAHDCSKCGKNL